ncbi:MAG: proteasome-type protease [Alphaproteobacteria bacterium]|jgi:putative proteasome-type protease|nr:proteasome-type protease [Alphaproteobacteria bacterium]
MTYCVGMLLDEGLVMVLDSRTNAGVDHIGTFRKMTIWETPGERVVILLTAGNLAIAQAVVNLLNEGLDNGESEETILTVPSMFGAARLVGNAVREVYRLEGEAMKEQGVEFSPSFILGGQIRDRHMRLFQIYAVGNFIEATDDTPFFQVGEFKYGKPILDRALNTATGLVDGVKLALVSMDSTMRSNISVGLPIDVAVYEKDSCRVKLTRRIEENDPYFIEISQGWSAALQESFQRLPDPDW